MKKKKNEKKEEDNDNEPNKLKEIKNTPEHFVEGRTSEIIINNVKEAILQRQAMSKNASITDNAEVYYEDAEDYTISYIDID